MDAARQTPLITELKGNSLDDGPGIRSVIFFKGCQLSCVWCHNPETRRIETQLSFEHALCVTSSDCLSVCDAKALDHSRDGFIDRDRCTMCLKCVETCPSGALKIVGHSWSVAELLEKLAPYQAFYLASNGGVTLSGGEATLFMDFASELLRALKDRGIHTLLETNGYFSYDRFMRLMAPCLDTIWMDIKLMDDAEHRQFCGKPNRAILDNFQRLQANYLAGGTPILARVPLVPGITATPKNLRAIAAFLQENKVERVSLLPYNPLWSGKAVQIGEAAPAPQNWMSPDEVAECRAVFEEFQLV